MALKTRKPTGQPPWPLILLEGEEKSGKTWQALEFTGDPRMGRAWALDLSEGSLDEYGAIPGADFELIDHDGTWLDIIDQLEEARNEARADRDAGKPPCVLVIDTITAEWEMLKAWADVRGRRQPTNAEKLRRNPDAEIKASRNIWNDVDARHKRFMTLLHTFPGVVIMTARGKEISATGKDGQPVPGEKDYRVGGQSNIGFEANAWVRLFRTQDPLVIGMRSTRHDLRPGKHAALPWAKFTLGALIFDVIGCDPATTGNRDMRQLDADQVMPDEEPVPAEDDQPQPPKPAVRRPTPEDIERQVSNGVRYIVAADTAEKASKMLATARDSIARNADVTEQLIEDDREVLGLADGEQVTLLTLAERVEAYVKQFSRAVRAPLDASPVEAAASKASAA